MPRPTRPGFNLIEVMVAMSMASLVVMALGAFIVSSTKGAGSEKDRAYAMQKALQMLNEIAAYKSTSATDPGISQFEQADGVYSFALTTATDAVGYQALSGNPKIKGYYKYVRHVDVEPAATDSAVSIVTVKVFHAAKSTTPGVDAKRPDPLAVVTNRFRPGAAAAGPNQVVDVYVLSVENVPHIYRKADDDYYFPSATEARLAFDASMRTFMDANPGIELRPHYITRMSVGRDPFYRPYVNDALGATTTTRDPMKWAYFMPGKLESAVDGSRYYDAKNIAGKIGVGDSSGNPGNQGLYPLADQFNHAVPYYKEFDCGTTNSTIFGTAKLPHADTPSTDTLSPLSLRQFMEELLTDTTGKYKNAVVVNLHGEMLPALPLRNYADAAKDPTTTMAAPRQRRLVTHPVRLAFPATGTTKAVLYMHPYMADGSMTPSVTGNASDVDMDETAFPTWAQEGRIRMKNVKTLLGGVFPNVTVSFVQRQRLDDMNNKAIYTKVYGYPLLASLILGASGDNNVARGLGPGFSGPHLATGGGAPRWDGEDFVIDLTDIDYDAREVKDGGDKMGHSDNPDGKLHGMFYFPDPFLATLNQDDDGKYTDIRNTARAIIEWDIPDSLTARRVEVETQLKTSTGYVDPATDPDHPTISRSQFYVMNTPINANHNLYHGSGATTYTPTIPWTDQVQLLGDPRHVPYLEARRYKLYNPYFADFNRNVEIYKGIKNKTTITCACSSYTYSSSSYCSCSYTSTWTEVIDFANPLAQTGAPSAWRIANASGSASIEDYRNGSTVSTYSVDTSYPGSADDWNSIKYNAPEYFRMWRQALYRNQAVFVNAGGEPIGYLGMGGEFSLATKVNDSAAIQIVGGPYTGSTTAIAGRDELEDETPVITREATGLDWIARPWLGELYPMDEWTNWSTKGNLPTGTNASGLFVRENLSDVPDAFWDKFAKPGKDKAKNRKKVDNLTGLNAFLNTDLDVNDESTQTTTLGTTAGANLQSAFGMNLVALKSRFAYKLGGGSTFTDEYTGTFWTARREPAEYLNQSFTGVSAPEYYKHNTTGYHASNPIVLTMEDAHPGLPTEFTGWRAFYLFNAFRPETIAMMPRVYDQAVAGAVGTFFDATRQGIGKFNVKPMPLITLTSPKDGDTLTGASKALTWTKAWKRVDDKPYSPTFDGTAYNGATAADSGGPYETAYFVKYKNLRTGDPWKLAKIASPAIAEAVCDAGDLPPTTVSAIGNTATTATWDISTLPAGEYLVRLEAYRRDANLAAPGWLPNHHAFHEIQILKN